MLFNSYIFVLLFLPGTLAAYYAINHFGQYKLANMFLIGMSLWFYAYFNRSYLFVILGSILGNYFISRKILICKERCTKKLFLILGICANAAVIFYFKYFNFFIENMNVVFGKNIELKNILLPLGISFFTFQQIAYLVDSYKEETKGYTFVEYMLFVSFFPQLIAGPIVSHNEIIPQFRNQEKRSFIPHSFAKGMYIFALGLFKKVIIADTFGGGSDLGFGSIETLSSMEAWIISISYTFQLYFDFSGYCDMASGVGYMFNIELPQNFNSPYKAASIIDFWNRWHMSLTKFLKKYIYIPLGGNRKGKIRTYINIMIVYLISGIWHGANWTFIIWGGIYGILNVLNRLFEKKWSKLERVTQWFITFMLVNILWVLFRAESLADAILFIKKMCGLSGFGVRPELIDLFRLKELAILGEELPFRIFTPLRIPEFYLWIFIFGAFFVVLNFRNSKEIDFKPTIARSLQTIIFMIWSIISFAGISTFLYFDF